MARESQGLQIALIVFVMLFIITLVTSFVLYRSWSDALAKSVQDKAEKQEADKAKAQADAERDDLKKFIGFGANDTIEGMQKQYAQTVGTLMTGFPEAERTFQKALTVMVENVRQRDVALAARGEEIKKLNDDLKKREATSQAQMAKLNETWLAAQKDYSDDRAKFVQDRNAHTKERTDLLATITKATKEKEDLVARALAEKDASDKELKGTRTRLAQVTGTVRALTKPQYESPAGRIEWVNQRNQTVWINLGESDYLAPLTTFAVYDADAANVAHAESKASIEVVQVRGPHLAEARITDERMITNPVLPGDVIHTPLWEPGRQKHFALVGLIDIDGDGKSDLKKVIQRIRMAGAVVDWYRPEEKGAPVPDIREKITPNTDYLVLGKEPGPEAAKDEHTYWSEANERANQYSIKKVTVPDLLSRVGYRPDTQVEKFGLGADPRQFRPTAPEGLQRKSGGHTAEIFEQRKPPVPTRGNGDGARNGAGGAKADGEAKTTAPKKEAAGKTP